MVYVLFHQFNLYSGPFYKKWSDFVEFMK